MQPMTRRRSRLVFFLCGLIAGAGLAQVLPVASQWDFQRPLPAIERRKLERVFSIIKADYVDPVRDNTLTDGAIAGMLGALDPHSSFLDRQEYRDLQIDTHGEFGGLGIELAREDRSIKVIAPIAHSPNTTRG